MNAKMFYFVKHLLVALFKTKKATRKSHCTWKGIIIIIIEKPLTFCFLGFQKQKISGR